MTDRESLLRTICEHPFDNVPRLVYADWLDEHGEAERAEFIRVQCGEVQVDQDRLVWLFQAIGEEMRPQSVDNCVLTISDTKKPSDRRQRLVIRRGFVDEIHCTQSEFLGGECGHCGGNGWIDQTDEREIERGRMTETCDECGGKGTLLGLVELFGSHPITRVTLTDREPSRYRGRWWWHKTSADSPDDLHAQLYDMLATPDRIPVTLYPSYATRDVAFADLSRACVALGRERAGLPPIVWPVCTPACTPACTQPDRLGVT